MGRVLDVSHQSQRRRPVVTVGLVVLAAVIVGFTGVDQFTNDTEKSGGKVKGAVKR